MATLSASHPRGPTTRVRYRGRSCHSGHNDDDAAPSAMSQADTGLGSTYVEVEDDRTEIGPEIAGHHDDVVHAKMGVNSLLFKDQCLQAPLQSI